MSTRVLQLDHRRITNVIKLRKLNNFLKEMSEIKEENLDIFYGTAFLMFDFKKF